MVSIMTFFTRLHRSVKLVPEISQGSKSSQQCWAGATEVGFLFLHSWEIKLLHIVLKENLETLSQKQSQQINKI